MNIKLSKCINFYTIRPESSYADVSAAARTNWKATKYAGLLTNTHIHIYSYIVYIYIIKNKFLHIYANLLPTTEKQYFFSTSSKKNFLINFYFCYSLLCRASVALRSLLKFRLNLHLLPLVSKYSCLKRETDRKKKNIFFVLKQIGNKITEISYKNNNNGYT